MFLLVLLPLLAASLVSGQVAPSFGTPAPPVQKSFDPNCKDKMDTCWKMPESNCRKPYEDWAKEYCPNRCGYCNGPTTPAPACMNKLPNCESYDKSVCTNPDYSTWAGDNCRYFCRMCSAAELARLDSMTTTVSPQDCVDKVDCRQYGPNACSDTFKAWSKDNCPLHCGYCSGIPTPPPVCEDKIPNCKAYNPDTCTDPDYKLWVMDNCKKFCGLCTNSQTIAYFPPTPPSPGKRAQGAERPKRQFQASHHHHGGSHDCWDGSSDDPYCNTAAPTMQETTPASSLDGSTGFPGSEFHPHPKPDPDWDSKPSTQAPTGTTHAKPPTVTGQATPTAAPSKVTTTTAPPTVTDSPTTTTAPPTDSQESTTTTAPPTVSESGSTTTTAPPTKPQASSTTTVSASGTTESPTGTDSTGPNQPDTPSTTVLAVKTPGDRSTASPGGPTPAQSTDTQGTDSPLTAATVSTSAAPLTNTSAPPLVTSAPSTDTAAPPSDTTTTTVTTTTGTTAEPCVDTVDNCAMYGKTACDPGVYRPWAMAHCSLFCEFCTPVTLTPFECKDKLSNCNEFDGGDLCTADSFFAWARENCFAYCGFPPCGNNTGVKATTTATPDNTTRDVSLKSSNSNCTDELDNCLNYPDVKCVGIYEPWARSNCAYRCGYCQEFLPCEDVNPDCDKYPQNSCSKDSFQGWARQNCRKYCNLCARPTENPAFTNTTGSSGGTPPTPEIPFTSVDPIMMSSKKP